MKVLTNLDELLKIMEDQLKQLKDDDSVCLIHHDDGDGCSSTAIFSILIHKLTGIYPILFPVRGPNNINNKLFKQLRTISPDYLFALDVTIDPKKLSIFKGFILDHHVSEFDEYGGMKYLNPRSFEDVDEKVVPTSYMTYRIMKKMFPKEKLSWIAGIGITEDHRVEICKDTFDDIKKDYPSLLKVDKINQINLEKSVFGRAWDIVRAGRMIKKTEGAKIAVLALVECKDRPDKFLNGLSQHSFALMKFYNRVAYETQYSLSEVKDRARFYREKKVIVYEMRGSKISALTSFIADKIRQEYPEYIVCTVGSEWGRENKKISIRVEQTKRDDNLIEILEKVKDMVPSVKGGGHKSAIGVFVGPDQYNEFLRAFLASV